MRAGTSRDPRKDDVLRPIFRAHREDQDPRWRTILTVIFWPALRSIYRRRRTWDRERDELGQTLYWIFLQVLHRVDVAKRPDRLVQKVLNDVHHQLYEEYARRWKREEWETQVDADEFEDLAGGVDGIDMTGIELRDAQEKAIRRLRAHLDAGRISESDFFLIVGTRIYGRPLNELASENGLDYQLVKRRRLRAEAAIRRVDGKPR
jgi:hypothetical protein